MKPQDFHSTCERIFAGLLNRYHLSSESSRANKYVWEWSVKNTTTGIRVIYETRDNYLFVQICRLIDGKIDCNVGEIWPDTVINCFDLEDLLSLRKLHHQHLYGETSVSQTENIALLVEKYVDSLKAYAEEILLGDFSVFGDMDKIVKERARMAAHKKWGEKAKEFGW